jgi:ribosome-binding factor A
VSTARAQRIADQIQRELAELVRLELRDPRVKLITITGVDVTRDYAHAKVYFTMLGTDDEVEACLAGLKRSAGFLRSALSHRLTTHSVPALAFVHDTSVERGMRLSQLIDEAVATEAHEGNSGGEAAAAPVAKPAASKPARKR